MCWAGWDIKASYRFSKKLTGKKRQSRALLFNNKKFR
jgi:hypothetical protein